ncbi:MAG: hypothetical protein ACOX3U_02595 [Christensenellales bacterium]|jgi:hypothetical protein
MKISQREKLMLMVLCVVMVCALVYMFFIKPKNEEKADLELERTQLSEDWKGNIKPFNDHFLTIAEAERLWKLDIVTLMGEIDNLYNNSDYLLGIKIKNKEAEAAQIAETSLLPSQDSFELFPYIYELYLKDYIDFNSKSITLVEDYIFDEAAPEEPPAEEGEEGEEAPEPVPIKAHYSIITISVFTCNNNQESNIYTMLNRINSCSYITVNSFSYNPSTLEGSIEMTIYMTPGDLNDYFESDE